MVAGKVCVCGVYLVEEYLRFFLVC